MMNTDEKILIIDFGSQFTKLIARRVREKKVYSVISDNTITIEKIKKMAPKAIILSGGPASVNDQNSPQLSKEVLELSIPILGICYGQQLIVKLMGGIVESSNHREYGRASLTKITNSKLLDKVEQENNLCEVWMSHGDRVSSIPKEFNILAHTDSAPYAAIAHETKNIYAIQFHPEVTHTINGNKIIENFLFNIAKCKGNWNMHNFADHKISDIKNIVGNNKVLCAVSGGVDSSVVAALINKAIGKNLVCVYIDNGLMRKNESKDIHDIFKSLNIELITYDGADEFLEALKNVSEPEQKRKVIGEKFIRIFEKIAKQHSDIKFLAQGTLYTDIIESASAGKNSDVIKSHHNVGGLPEKMNFSLIEPLNELFKDEVRILGAELGLPHEILYRHPFPGPGLAIRIVGEVTKEKVQILQEVDAIYIKLLKEHDLYKEIWQAFAVLLPVKTVGVMGDARSYENVVALRAVESLDGMSADFYHLPYKILGIICNQIINNVKGVNRVVYDITSKPPGTIEWE
jgi:GMP synthase (glutamine-hydrolysing)